MTLLWLIRFIVPISCVICNDIMAYMFGFFFGRTPLIKVGRPAAHLVSTVEPCQPNVIFFLEVKPSHFMDAAEVHRSSVMF